MAKTRPFGSTATATSDDNDTPQQKNFEKATGKDSDSATGDVARKDAPTGTTLTAAQSRTPMPSGVDNQELWAAAEQSALGATGGFSGSSTEGRQTLIRQHYDQMVENDKATRKWAGDDSKNGILGDIGQSK